MTVHIAEKLRCLDELRAWTPPGIRVLVVLVAAVGIATWCLEWRSMPFNAFAIFTGCAAKAARMANERRAENAERDRRQEQELAAVYANAAHDIVHR